MKKTIALPLLSLGLFMGLIATWQMTRQRPVQTQKSTIQAFEMSSAYEIDLDVTQRRASSLDHPVSISGVLVQQSQTSAEFVTEWASFAHLALANEQSSADLKKNMLHQPILSRYDEQRQEYIHFGQDLDTNTYGPLQLSLLNKIFLPFPFGDVIPGVISRTERDDIGAYRTTYTIQRKGDGYQVLRSWQQYLIPGVKVDADEDTLLYTLSATGQMLSVDGRLTLHFHLGDAAHVTTEIHGILKGSPSAQTSLAQILKDQTRLTKLEVRSNTVQAPTPTQVDTEDFNRAMNELDSLDETSDSRDLYQLFGRIKTAVINDPTRARSIFDKIKQTTARDDASKRRLTVLFGALAQSESPQIAEELADYALECPDSFCKMQAIVGVSDHPHPGTASAEKMLAIATSSNDKKIAGTALLATGAIAYRLGSPMPDLKKTLISNLENPAKVQERSTTVAAMGNHGDPDYLESLETLAKKSTDPFLQASAVYSLRYLPQASINQTLLTVLAQSKDKNVMLECFKTMEYRSLSLDQYQNIATHAGVLPDPELVAAAARLLTLAYQDNAKVGGPLRTLRDTVRSPELQAALDVELAKAPPIPK